MLTVLITCLQLWRRGLLRPVLRCDRGVLYWQPTARGLAVAGRMRGETFGNDTVQGDA